MKKFRFPLRSVQTVRAIHEMRAREAFSAAVAAVNQAEAVLRGVQALQNALHDAMLSGRGDVVRPLEQVSFLQEQEFLKLREKAANEELTKANAKKEECRQLWILARRDLKIIDNLETKARQEYRLEFDREEQKLIDDRTNSMIGREPLLMS